jgi:hypothetical protein
LSAIAPLRPAEVTHEPESPELAQAVAGDPVCVPPVDAAEETDDAFTQTLPRDHPAWIADACSISARARALLAQIRPLVVRVLSFWDQRVRHVDLAEGRLYIDQSGCYRLEAA